MKPELTPTDHVNSKAQESGSQKKMYLDPSLFLRECSVLAGGCTDGLKDAGQTTVTDLQNAGKKFYDNPLGTTTEYLSNHWQEALAGAAISVVAPTGMANALIVGYSLRGFLAASVEAGFTSLYTNRNTDQIRNLYSRTVSHEGSQFLASLPMAMAGGWLGRAGANQAFGKDMGATDFLTGKVKAADIKANLWAVRDGILPPAKKLVIADLDNTLYNFSKYQALGMKKGITDISAKTGLSEDLLYKTIGKQMKEGGCHDYLWAIELGLSDTLDVSKPGGPTPKQFHEEIVKPFLDTVDQALDEHNQLYDKVEPTLRELKERHIPVVILSDGAAFMAQRRLTTLKLDQGLVERMYALDHWQEPANIHPELLELGRQRIAANLQIPHQLKELRIIPRAWEKPNTQGFKQIMEQYGVRPSEVLMIGDNQVRDLGVAYHSDAHGIWAKYGMPDAEYKAVFSKLIPNDSHHGPVGQESTPPMLGEASDFSHVLDHLQPKANYWKVAGHFGKSLAVLPRWQSAYADSLMDGENKHSRLRFKSAETQH